MAAAAAAPIAAAAAVAAAAALDILRRVAIELGYILVIEVLSPCRWELREESVHWFDSPNKATLTAIEEEFVSTMLQLSQK